MSKEIFTGCKISNRPFDEASLEGIRQEKARNRTFGFLSQTPDPIHAIVASTNSRLSIRGFFPA
ncbi:MAG: hypothetical protein LH628_23280 [Microcoleus sp. CAN_BIN18]|nr:hypothetical protein [Microcoleus sp. CAN_BIN18]